MYLYLYVFYSFHLYIFIYNYLCIRPISVPRYVSISLRTSFTYYLARIVTSNTEIVFFFFFFFFFFFSTNKTGRFFRLLLWNSAMNEDIKNWQNFEKDTMRFRGVVIEKWLTRRFSFFAFYSSNIRIAITVKYGMSTVRWKYLVYSKERKKNEKDNVQSCRLDRPNILSVVTLSKKRLFIT